MSGRSTGIKYVSIAAVNSGKILYHFHFLVSNCWPSSTTAVMSFLGYSSSSHYFLCVGGWAENKILHSFPPLSSPVTTKLESQFSPYYTN